MSAWTTSARITSAEGDKGDLRTQALSTTAIERARGIQIAKTVGSKQVDAISALAIARVSAVRAGHAPPMRLLFTGAPATTQPMAATADEGERAALWAVVAPVLEALQQGDEEMAIRADDALEQYLLTLEERDPAAGQRGRALVAAIETAIEARDHVA